MAGPWEKYGAAPASAGPWSKYQAQQPQSQDPETPSLKERFLAGFGQKDIPQPSGFDVGDVAEFVGREGLPAIGGTLGAVGGPAGSALGAAAGRAAQRGIGQGINLFSPGFAPQSTPGQVLGDVGLTGATQGLFEAATPVVSGIAKRIGSGIKDAAVGLGSQVMRATAAIPEKYGRAALSNPSLLSNAPSKQAASEAYQAFERYTGLKGLRDASAARGQLITRPGDAEGIVNSAYAKIASGEALPAQEAYEASQAARFLKDQARFGDPNQLANLSNINRAKGAIDDFLEGLYPEYKSLRQDTFAQKTAEQFSSALPLNKNQSVNQLRGFTTIGGAVAGTAATGSPLPLLAIPATSPAFYGAAIRGGYRAGQAASAIGQTGIPEALLRGGVLNIQDKVVAQSMAK